MPGLPTPILGLAVPTVGGDNNVWGTELNADLLILDSLGALGGSASLVGRTLVYGISAIQLAFETGGVGGITDVLPSAVGQFGKGFLVKKVDAGAGAVTLSTSLGQTILDIGGPVTSYSLVNQGQYLLVVSDGSNWQIIANN
jgi:hypothetical protein